MSTAAVKCDLSGLDSPEEAAKALHEYIRGLSRDGGQDPDIEVALFDPERGQEMGYGPFWRVMWESGPFEWGVCVSLGGRVHESDYRYAYDSGSDVHAQNDNWYLEPYHSFDVGFITS